MIKTFNLVHVLNLTQLFKTFSSHIIFSTVEELFAIQDGRHRKLEFNITLHKVQKTYFES